MAVKSLEDALINELKDLLSAEKQIAKALTKMAKKASNEKLKQAFQEHQEQTEQQAQRLEQVFEKLGRKAASKRCEAMEGIIEEGKELMEKDAEPDVRDAMLIMAAQKVEHYEIASYGTVCTWAERLGQNEALDLLKQTLEEEKQTDQKLNKLAKSGVNKEAKQ